VPRVVILVLLVSAPLAGGADPLADAARALARRVATALAVPFTVEIRNLTSLPIPREAIQSELRDRPRGTDVSATFTLSEAGDGLLWIAEIVRAGSREAVLMERAGRPEPRRESVVIEKRLVWEQEQPMLDAVITADDLLILTPSGLAFRTPGGEQRAEIPIQPPRPWPRDLQGRVLLAGEDVRVVLPGLSCTGKTRPVPALDCTPSADQPTEVEAVCGGYTLAARPGRIGEPDSIRAFRDSTPGSDAVDFPGPVLSLHGGVAIVRNLETGVYAAYRLLLTCGH
jgi:hypothetical protein